jgi:cyclohexadieny/prephenate dehydrogenase
MSKEVPKPPFQRVALIGMGLIGSSLARVMNRKALAGAVAGCARSAATRAKALELDLAESMHEDPADAVRDADLVVICTPLGTYEDIARRIAPNLAAGAIVSDVGSVKQAVIRDLGPFIPEGVHLVPGHPVAGTEHSGPEAGFAELFEDRWCILTPPPGTDAAAVDSVAALWRACGSLAYTIVGTATDLEENVRAEVVKFSAGGFRDFTRIAGSDPIMWRDVFLNNREAVLEMLQRFSEDLTALQRAIRWGEGEVLESWFRRTREIRRGVIEAHQAGTFDAREPEKAATLAPDPDRDDHPEE